MAYLHAFRSGMSRVADFHGAAKAGVSVGVVAGEMPFIMALIGLPKYIAKGGAAFIDSGAFSEVTSGVPPDFKRVLETYETVATSAEMMNADLTRLYVVAPDKVGDQQESLARLRYYRYNVLDLIDMGCRVIVPIQSGEMPVAQMLAEVISILGTDDFVAGIPSNKSAMRIEDCETLRHHSFHVLGRVQESEEQVARLRALESNNPGSQITADANWLRSRLKVICRLAGEERVKRQNLSRGEQFVMGSARTVAIAAAIESDTQWAKTT